MWQRVEEGDPRGHRPGRYRHRISLLKARHRPVTRPASQVGDHVLTRGSAAGASTLPQDLLVYGDLIPSSVWWLGVSSRVISPGSGGVTPVNAVSPGVVACPPLSLERESKGLPVLDKATSAPHRCHRTPCACSRNRPSGRLTQRLARRPVMPPRIARRPLAHRRRGPAPPGGDRARRSGRPRTPGSPRDRGR